MTLPPVRREPGGSRGRGARPWWGCCCAGGALPAARVHRLAGAGGRRPEPERPGAGAGAGLGRRPPPPGRPPGPRSWSASGCARRFAGFRRWPGSSWWCAQGDPGLVGPNGSGKSTLINLDQRLLPGGRRPGGGRRRGPGAAAATEIAAASASRGRTRSLALRPFDRAGQRLGGRDVRAAAPGSRPAEREAAAGSSRGARRARRRSTVGAEPAPAEVPGAGAGAGLGAPAGPPRRVLSGLTPAEIAGAVPLVRDIRDGGTTVVFVEHVMRAVMDLADRVVVLNAGEVIAEGPPRR